MESNGSGTGVFFLVAFGCIGLFLVYWLGRAQPQTTTKDTWIPATAITTTCPSRRPFKPNRDAVVRMEAGENTDGLPKYTPRAAIGEQTVDRNVTTTESRQANDESGQV
ncbi:hypothetical protein RHS01_02944 [Rhizoctonia solani]|uniref:Uncharacterized protein n=1 Tax=Rhizoctonia solani TaxID=456999 RepID=A0A8H7ILA5_9AGAM|nr:hypothetical protein RHS01_02944 [Rhizoctonia solani]